jgi:outer membrane immunogenic protein
MKQHTRFILMVAIVCTMACSVIPSASGGPERMSSKEMASTPVVEQPFSWTGFYIGGNIGANLSDYTFSRFDDVLDLQGIDNQLDSNTGTDFSPQTFFFPNFSQAQSVDLGTNDSLMGGGQIGVNKQWGHFVIGLEGDFQATGANNWETFTNHTVIPEVAFNNEQANIDFTATRKAATDWMASARGRIGYASGPLLIYATGGVAFADVNVWAIDTATVDFLAFSGPLGEPAVGTTNRNVARADDIQVGWTAGGGIEWAPNDMFSIGIEGRHSDFGSNTYRFGSNGTFESPGSTRINLENNMVVVRFNLLLNHFFGH